MSIKHDAEELGRIRKRDIHLRNVLAQSEPIVIKGDAPAPAPAAAAEDGSAAGPVPAPAPLVDRTFDEQQLQRDLPKTVIPRTERAGFRNGIQYRPQTTREREEEMNNRMDAQAVANYARYCDLVQQDLDTDVAQENDRQKRMSRELRTGLRPMPNSADHCSLEEAVRRGLVGRGED